MGESYSFTSSVCAGSELFYHLQFDLDEDEISVASIVCVYVYSPVDSLPSCSSLLSC